jgi:3-deoxy-manno-octulosonate cytidylyltransferase (CMP-KDO synthetase)
MDRSKGKDKIIAVIPARFESSRLPGKPLADIGGKPMIQWVVEAAKGASLISKVVIATDDERIFSCVGGFGGEAVLTPKELSSGTERAAYAAGDLDADIVVNIQGDEPFVRPKEIDDVARLLLDDEEAVMGTIVKKIIDSEALKNPNTVKVVVDRLGYAIYFSRSPIPFSRDKERLEEWIENTNYYRHIGIYSYRKDFLLQIIEWTPTPLERVEKLEQLRVLEHGYRIKVAETDFESIDVNTQDDLTRARQKAEEEKHG